ncbi:retinitis pigmentosa 1-like 1 protein [Dendrobates tinctorius]|uniref:retinitis pigmentosa 1-like 1 protein n=1 Tax=Dendrobates tinctorius TaxID=92724 RepID=UPI003CC957E1
MNPSVAEGYSAPPSSPDRPFPPVVRSHAVSVVTPAKKITFFKSGDPQFSGVKMAINRRSFKSFSALMDDLSNKVPLPFGVRTITTPRGTHNISRLEQLQDGGSYICSDKKHVQPMAGHKGGNHRGIRPDSSRKQGQHGDSEEEYSATHFQQVPKVRKKIVLVKNGDPTIRRSVILNRRNARNFRTFLEDASDLLQYTVRRLYTVDGRKIENIQAVLQSSNILICAGKEPFKPIQMENMRKSVPDKLPGLRSHLTNNSEVMDNKKNANFGLKAKKSVIHPRSASSKRTSLSSEKSYPNGLNMSPVNSGYGSYPNMCPREKSAETGHSLLNDDIEKKVHVNKDGSLSVEMKVRFRLLNEETLQWSTQIKKSSTIGKAKCEQLSLYDENMKMGELHTENYSETDESFYPCDGDSYTSKINDAGTEDMCCSHCGMQCQEYDIWKNPMHINQQGDYVKRATWQTRSSTSSTSSRHRLVCNEKASIDSPHSMSSEEYTEHIVQNSSHYSEIKENGDTTVTYSTVSQCASRSGRSTSNVEAISDNEQTKICRSQSKSISSLNSQGSMKNLQSEEHCSHRSHAGSSEECAEASPIPCSDSENCSARISVGSQSSLHSRKSKSGIMKKNSSATKSFASNLSHNEEEEETNHPSSKGSLKNMQGISSETGNSEDLCGSEPAEEKNSSHDSVGIHSEKESSRKTSLDDCDNRSTRTLSRSSTKSRSSSKKSVKVNGLNENSLRNSPCLSSVSKQNSENFITKLESIDDCENSVSECEITLPQSKRTSFSEHQGQSFQSTKSCQSVSSISESVKPSCVQDEEQTLSHQESCNEPLTCAEKSDQVVSDDGELPISRASSKSLSSKFNCASCHENEPILNASSRVSSVSERSSIVISSEKVDQNSIHDSNREMSQAGDAVNDDMVADFPRQTEASDKNSIQGPSPPEGKPTHQNVRLAHFRLSSSSMSSDQVKTMNGEKTDISRTSTPGSKGMTGSRDSTETCKRSKTVVTSHNSAEGLQSTKKCKNSSSSSKKRHKGEYLDAVNSINIELVPSALPNVTPEEVVNEWLRKIPSQTMVVECEVEECQKKKDPEIGTDESKTDIDMEPEEGQLIEESVKEEHNSSETKEEISQDVNGIITENDIQDINISDAIDVEESLSSKVAANNVKNESVPNEFDCDKKFLPNNVQTSVQIMKALLKSLQDSKFDRSNSVPEVSQTMGRKLSNSATVLISCLASLQLLDESQTEITKSTNDIRKPKYFELLNILQALWVEGSTNKSIANIKSGKRYSRDDELTPVSSSGVDINSGFEGSGDGSITCGGDHMVTIGRPDDGKLSTKVAKEVECATANMQSCEQRSVIFEEHSEEKRQEATNEEDSASFQEVKPCSVDENMNEKKFDDSENAFETNVKDETEEEGHYNSVNNVNVVECIEVVEEHRISNNDNMNILSHDGEPKSNEPNSPETNNISSPNDSPSTVISTSDSNGKNKEKKGHVADPVWVLKLLKKIEKEFMTHYVDAMNEFKVRWNLEDNENLDKMITELKNEVSERIQRSISSELKRIQSQTGARIPRPPVEGKFSLQADERRRRLQSMHRVSMHRYACGDNRDVGTNEISSETDEEDLTFSASFGDDSSGLPNGDFCPCEKCIKQKRALKLAKPQAVAINAPIIKAFDLQQILKVKRENNDPKYDVGDAVLLPPLKEQSKEADQSIVNGCSTENEDASNEAAGEEIHNGESDILIEDSISQEVKSVKDECEGCDSSDFQSIAEAQERGSEQLESNGLDEEIKPTEDLEDDFENSNSDVLEKNSAIAKETSINCPDGNTSVCEDNENNDEHSSDCPHTEQKVTNNIEEMNETENEGEINTEEVHVPTDEFSGDEDHIEENETTDPNVQESEDHLVKNETTNPDVNTEDNVEEAEEHLVENETTNPINMEEDVQENEDNLVENETTNPLINMEEDVQENEDNLVENESTNLDINTEDVPEDEDHNVDNETHPSMNTEEDFQEDESHPDENETTNPEINTKDDGQEVEDHLAENEITNSVNSTEEDVKEEGGSYLHKLCMGQVSLITHNGSAENAEAEYKENHNAEETFSNGQSNKTQMYPDSSSVDEDGDSSRDSPDGVLTNETVGQVYVNNNGSFEKCDDKCKNCREEDIIDQEDLDF